MRNYEKEAEWRKKNYKRFSFKMKNEEAEKFKEALKKNGIGFTEWAKTRAEKYINENK